MFHFGLPMAAGQASNTRDPAFPISFPRGAFPPARAPLPLLLSILRSGGGKWGEGQGGIGEFIFRQAPTRAKNQTFLVVMGISSDG